MRTVGPMRTVVLLLGVLPLCLASLGDTDPRFRLYVEECARTGCLDAACIPGCVPPVEAAESAPGSADSAWNASQHMVTGPLELVLTHWDCLSECRFRSMELRQGERGGQPIKYFGKWPFTRLYGLQEPGSVAFSLLNLAATLYGLLSFASLVYFQLPMRQQGGKGTVYEYTGLVLLYGVAQCNSWLWSAVFHSRDMKLTEALDYSSAIALLGLGLLFAIIRSGGIRTEAPRVIVAAPIIAFFATHICYLNFYQFDYGWNIIVCSVVGVLQLLLWMVWSAVVRHPAAVIVWLTCLGTGAAMLLEIYDFPPFWGLLDAHALWHAATVPLTLLWWAFLKADARHRTKALLGKGARRSTKKTK